tara:strand:+ start:44 stop:481 length:438 start_codon:yes stop_codon:yes gene_type:complete
VNEVTNQQTTPTLGSNEPDINILAFRWRLLKDAEEKAKLERVQCESDMLPFLEQREEGATTTTLEDGTKITVKNSFGRSIHWDTWKRIQPRIPTELHPIKLVEMLDETRLKFLLQNEPDTYKIISEAITTTPRKPNITVKKAEQS